MPLLNKNPFVPDPIPSDLRPDEEIFVCQATKEVFRDYELFFNRHFLCNSLVWTCELTGQSNLTYTQALESEKEAREVINSIPLCYQRASLSLIHHTRRTNLRTLSDEICGFYRERFIVGEQVGLTQNTNSGTKVVTPVRVLKVIPPEQQTPRKSPVKVPVITLSPSKKGSPSPTSFPLPSPLPPPPPLMPINSQAAVGENKTIASFPMSAPTLPHLQTNDPSPSANNPQDITPCSESQFKSPKLTPRNPSTPLTPEASLNPADYKYIVEMVQKPEIKLQVLGKQLSRPKGTLNPKKLKLFLRNALQRQSEKHPFSVKVEFVQKFSLGPTSVDPTVLPSPTPKSSRKRSLSQASLDTFFTPGEQGASDPKKSRPTSLDTYGQSKKARKKKTPKTPKTPSGKGKKSKKASKLFKKKSPSKTPRSPSKKVSVSANPPDLYLVSPKAARTPKSPKTPKSPHSKMEALKVLNKAKKFKQLDLKKNIVKGDVPGPPLTLEELMENRRRMEEERQRKALLREMEKQQKKEERLQKLRELHEQRRLEKLRQKELMKPREDLLLLPDSKPLPSPTAIATSLHSELFGEAVMLMEFLHTFGPLFNIREVIRGGITFEKMEHALVTNDMDSLLFDILRFLLQAIFATMEEENEKKVNVTHREDLEGMSKPELENGDDVMTDDHQDFVNKTDGAEKMNVDGEVGQEREGTTPVNDEEMERTEDEEKPLDVQVESIKTSAAMFAKWSHLTQRTPLSELVLDAYTCTEVLRLHLLASGGYADSGDRSWFRHSRRGGYSDADDPAIAFRLRRPDILDALSHSSIYDLPPVDKLEVLSTLCSQLLSYSVVREYIDEAAARAKLARRKIREVLFSEERRKKEEKSAQHKEKMVQARLKKQMKDKKETTDPSAQPSVGPAVPESEQTTEEIQPGGDSTTLREGNNENISASREPSPSLGKNGARQTCEEEKVGDETKEEVMETEEERKVRIDEELNNLYTELSEASAVVNLRPIGSDRHRRRYWLFASLPGLYVEDPRLDSMAGQHEEKVHATGQPVPTQTNVEKTPTSVKSQIPQRSDTCSTAGVIDLTVSPLSQSPPVASPHISQDLNTSKTANFLVQEDSCMKTQEVDLPATSEESLESGNTSQQQHHQNVSSQLFWSCYTMPEAVDSLLAALNPRGLREVELKKALETWKPHILRTLSRCPFHPDHTAHSSTALRQPQYNTANEFLELYLREQILDIEEKIYIGNLGFMKDVQHRGEWRNVIENSGAAAVLQTTTDQNASNGGGPSGTLLPEQHPPTTVKTSRPTSPVAGEDDRGRAAPLVSSSVQELSKALLQVQAGIEKKFLMVPLGMAVDMKKKRGSKKNGLVKEGEICLEQWRASLAKATSFSQIFVHLATLERAVMWSKSLMNVRCRICRRKGGDEFMLLCDGCDHGYHMYCLRPPLVDVPEGDWFCYDCHPVTPVKPRRRVQRVVFQEVSSESESEEEEQADEGSGEEEEEEKEELEEEESEEEELVTTKKSLRSRGRFAQEPNVRRSSRLRLSYSDSKGAKGKAQMKKGPKKRRASSEPKFESAKKSPSKTPEGVLTSYENTKARKKLKLDNLPSPVQPSKAETVIASIVDVRCSQSQSRQQSSAHRRELMGLEMQLCNALWEEVSNHDDSWHFATPVKKKECPDYSDIISEPMDLRTIRSKIKRGIYTGLDSFLKDVQLIFFNCLKYNKRHSEVGKAGAALKRFFEKRCSDLGLKDLNLCEANALVEKKGASPALRSSSRLRK